MAVANGRQVSWVRRLWLFGLAIAVALVACSDQSSTPESIGEASQALTSAQQRILGFESVGSGSTDWTTTSGSLTQSTRHVEGAKSLAIASGGNAEIKSAALSSLGPVADKITLDLLLPAAQPNPNWMGTIRLVIECPSQLLHYEGLTEYQLQGKPTEQFLRFDFPLSASTREKLSTGTYSDLRFKILLNVPSGAGPWLLDRLSIADANGGGSGGSGGSGGGSGGAGTSGISGAGQAGSNSPTSNNAAILGFENPALWIGSAGHLSSSDARLEGTHSLQVADVSYVELTTLPLTTLGSVSSVIGFDLSVPNPVGDVGWWGSAAVSIDCPSRGINNRWIGQQELNGATLDRFRRVEAVLPDDVKAALSTGAYADLRVKVILTVPAGSGPYLLDRFTFHAQLPEPAPPAPSDAVDKALGMETLESWKATAATLRLSSDAAERASSLAVSDFQYTEVSSTRLSSLGTPLKNELTFDVWIPVPPTPYWAGSIAASISIPSKGINSQVIGQQDVLPLEKATWQRIRFPLTTALVSALQGSYSDLRVSFALNRPTQPEPWKLDGVSFGQKSLSPPTPAFTETYVVPLPAGSTFGTVAIGQALVRSAPFFRAGGSMDVLGSPLTSVARADGQFSEVVAPRGIDDDEANVLVGPGASVGSVAAFRSINNSGTVHGNARAGSGITGSGTLTGTSAAGVDLLSREAAKLTVAFPEGAGAPDVTVSPSNPAASPAPGASYDFVSATTAGTITLRTGSYYINHLSIGRGTELRLDNANGPILVYVRETFLARGSVSLLDRSKWNVLFVVTSSADVKIVHGTHFEGTVVAPKTSNLRIDPDNDPSVPAYTAGSFFGRAVFAGYKIEHHPFVRDDCGAGSCGVFGCDTADRDGDGLYDCQEASDGDPFTDPDRFNGLRAYGYRSSHRSVDPTAIDTQAEVDASIEQKFEQHDVYSGWNLDGQALLDVGCRREMEFWPPWPVCHEASYHAFNYSGFVKLATSGQHCFAISQTSTSIAGALFLGDLPGLTSSDGKRCTNLDAGVYPLRFMVEVTGFQDVNSLADDQFKVAYCSGDCNPVDAVPQGMLRPDFPPSGGCTANGECLSSQFCSKAGECRDDDGECSSHTQCAPGQNCQNGSCSPPCQSDADCDEGLACVAGAGPRHGLPRGTSFCELLGCSGDPRAVGCNYAGAPCGLCDDGVGCDTNQDCPSGEVCGLNLGWAFGANAPNACVPPECLPTPAASDCGTTTSKCGECPVSIDCDISCGDDPSNGAGGRCRHFCADREPGCSADSDCQAGSACIFGGGYRVGLSASANICLPNICIDPNPARQPCGSTSSVCGLCAAIPEGACQAAGIECGPLPGYGGDCGSCPGACLGGKCTQAFEVKDLDADTEDRDTGEEITIPAIPVSETATVTSAGALAGNFAVSDRGTPTYSVDIVVPPGRAELAPEVSLNYTGGAPNGLVGVGWSIGGVSTISRCPTIQAMSVQGFARSVAYDSSDLLCLDGHPLIVVDGSYWADGSEYRTEIETFNQVHLFIDPADGQAHFRVRRKDGQVLTYGASVNSRLYRDLEHGLIRAWALSQVADRAGNTIDYTYGKFENTDPRHGSATGKQTVEFWPSAIVYGNRQASNEPSRAVLFNYDAGRTDYMDGHTRGGARIARTQLLASIETQVDGATVRRYELEYEQASLIATVGGIAGVKRLKAIRECSLKNGSRVCTRPTTFDYLNEQGLTSNTTLTDIQPFGDQVSFQPTEPIILDWNGDGRDDLLVRQGKPGGAGVWNLLLATGDDAAPYEVVNTQLAAPSALDPRRGACFTQNSVFDRNLDGKADLFDPCRKDVGDGNTNGYQILLSTGDTSSPFSATSVRNVEFTGDPTVHARAFLVDVNGDGLKDLFECIPGRGAEADTVRYHLGLDQARGRFDSVPQGMIPAWGHCDSESPDPMLVADVDGDGLDDLLHWGVGGALPSPQIGFEIGLARYVAEAGGSAHWEFMGQLPDHLDDSIRRGLFRFLDVNGDGLKDLLALPRASTPSGADPDVPNPQDFREPLLFVNWGAKFDEGIGAASSGAAFLASRPTPYSIGNSLPIDYNGDGLEDLIRPLDYHAGDPTFPSLWQFDPAGTSCLPGLGFDAAPTSPGQSQMRPLLPGLPPTASVSGIPGTKPIERFPIATFADADGDGSPDFLSLDHNGFLQVIYGKIGRTHLLSRVTDGLGKRITVEYQTSQEYLEPEGEGTFPTYTPGTSCAVVGDGAVRTHSRCVNKVGPVVSAYEVQLETTADNFKSDSRYQFRYSDAREAFYGRGWLGFQAQLTQQVVRPDPNGQPQLVQTVISTRHSPQLFDETYKLFPLAGLEKARITSSANAKSPIENQSVRGETTTSNEWELEISSKARPFPFLHQVATRIAEVEFDGTSHALQEAVTVNEPDIQGFGNVASSTTYLGRGGLEQFGISEVLTDFDIREADWLISLPQRVETTDTVLGGADGTEELQRVIEYGHDENGLLISLTREPDASAHSSLKQTTTLTREPTLFHQVTNVKVEGTWTDDDGELLEGLRETAIDYDDDAIFTRRVSQSVNGHVLATDLKFDPRDGTLLTKVDATGTGQQWAYDAFGRTTTYKDATQTATRSYEDSAFASSPVIDVAAKLAVVTISQTTGAASTQRFDALGRAVQTETKGFQGKPVFQEVDYLFGGLVRRASRPHLAGSTNQGVAITEYDARFRVARRTFPDDTFIQPLYASAGNLAEDAGIAAEPKEIAFSGVSSPKQQRTFSAYDYRGSPLRVVDQIGNATRYAYGTFGTLRSITDADDNTTVMVPDALGRIIGRLDPDTGVTEYKYTAFDEVRTFTDSIDAPVGEPRRTSFQYDAVGRLESFENDVDGLTSYAYDGLAADNELGRLVTIQSPDQHVERYRYEPAPQDRDPLKNRGFISSIDRLIAGIGRAEPFTTSFGYNDAGQLENVSYPPSGNEPFTVHYGYDEAGHLTCVGDHAVTDAVDGCGPHQFWQWQTDDQGYRVQREAFGNGVTTTYGYDASSGRLNSIVTKTGSAVLQELEYDEYDYNGNLTHRKQTFKKASGNGTDVFDETFTYDDLDRLTDVTRAQGPGQTIRYFDNGNIRSKSGGVGNYSYDPLPGEVFRPHAVQTVSTLDGTTTLKYDGAGNVRERSGQGVKGGVQTYTHTAFNLPRTVTLGAEAATTVRYEYDANQHRVVTRTDDGDGDPTNDDVRVYAGSEYEQHTSLESGVAVTRHEYKVVVGNTQVAQVERDVRDGAAETERRRYIHGDHLGSSQLVTDEDGQLLHVQRFDSFGAAEQPLSDAEDAAAKNIRAGFTGHESDLETGLVNMQGRIYDPRIGRFLQADPMTQMPFSQGLNRYSYVLNSPLGLTDPTGFCYDTEGSCDGEPEDDDPDDRTAAEGGTAPAAPGVASAPTEVAQNITSRGSDVGSPGFTMSRERATEAFQYGIEANLRDGKVAEALEVYYASLNEGFAVTWPGDSAGGRVGASNSRAAPSTGSAAKSTQASGPSRGQGQARGNGRSDSGGRDGGGGGETRMGEAAQAVQSGHGSPGSSRTYSHSANDGSFGYWATHTDHWAYSWAQNERGLRTAMYVTGGIGVAAGAAAGGIVLLGGGGAGAGAGAGAGGGGGTFYRILLKGGQFFESNAARGLPARGAEVGNKFIHEGISAWNSLAGALKKAAYLEARGQTVVGIAELRIPAGAAVGIQQTFSRGHYTLNAAAETFKEFWTFSWLK